MIRSTFKKGTVGYTMEVADQEGRNAWACGFDIDECPYNSEKNLVAAVCWKTGWTVTELAFEKILADEEMLKASSSMYADSIWGGKYKLGS